MSNQKSKRGRGEDAERHEFQFRGTFNSRTTHELLRDGKITSTEFCLLAVIDSLNGPEGCYASKAYLASYVRVLPRHVQKMIKHLTEIGLVYADGQKLFRKKWCRILRIRPWGVFNGSPPGVFNGSLSKDSRKHTPGSSTDRERSGRDEMGFFENEDTIPREAERCAPADRDRAQQLRSGLVAKGVHLARRWSQKKWTEQFRILRQDLNDDQRLDRVFRWYLKNVGGDYVPEALCAETFRKKFTQIERAMGRDKDAVAAEVKVSQEAKEMVDFYKNLGWPKGSKDLLPAATQLSLDNYHKFRKKLQQVKNPLVGHAEQILIKFAGGFIPTWFRLVHEKWANWPKWSADLKSMTFHPNHKLFVELARGWMRDYCGNPGVYDKLLESTNA